MIRTVALMGTLVTIQVVDCDPHQRQAREVEQAVDRAFGWFREIEARCTRFDARSEVMGLSSRIGVPVRVSEILYETVRFALEVAEESGGAFDPTIGHVMETRGFNREYRTGHLVQTDLVSEPDISFRDVYVNPDSRTVTLGRPLVLDLGAVAKGLAVDMAARELQPCEHFAIDAGGDLRLGGCNSDGESWSVGIRHPRRDGELLETLRVSNLAVCTSGDYERRNAADGHHILDPRVLTSANSVASATVVAPTAMLADALATAAFVLGPTAGILLLQRHGVDGLIVSPTLECYATRGLSGVGPTILSNAEGPAHAHLCRVDDDGRDARRNGAGPARAG